MGFVGGIAALGTCLYAGQEGLIFHPLPWVEHDPSEIGLPFEAVRLQTSDGETLEAWFVEVEDARGALLYFHGNAGNLGHRVRILSGLAKLGLNVLMFDYRGYGHSTGWPSESGTYRDAEAAWSYLVEERGVEPRRIALWGRSLGGAVATGLAAQQRAGALVLESTFTSIPDLGSELYPFLPQVLGRIEYPTRARLREIDTPLLYAHSPQDDLVGFHHGEALFESSAAQTKSFIELSGSHVAGHLTAPQFHDRVDAFLRRVIPDTSVPADR